MKQVRKLIIFLTINTVLLSGLRAQEKHTIELPEPSTTKREKHIIKLDDLGQVGYVCHNFVREKEIAKKLSELKIRNESACKEYKRLAQEVSPEISIFDNTGLVIGGFAVSFALGAGFIIYLQK